MTEVLIGEISKMQVGRDGIFVLDRNQTKGVYLFSSDGRLSAGSAVSETAPESISPPFDFSLDQNDELFILTGANNGLINMISTGKFIGYITVNPVQRYRSY